MLRKFFKCMAVVGLTVLAAASCKTGIEESTGGTVSSAVRFDVTGITAASAKVTISATSDKVVSYILAGPVLASELDYLSMDAITRLAAVEEKGREVQAPFSEVLTPLNPKTKYVVGAVALDAAGNYISAPAFTNFTTGSASIDVTLTFDDGPAGVVYTYKATGNSNTASISWIYSTDASHYAMDADALKALIIAGKDPLVKKSTDAVNGTLNYGEMCNAVFAAVAFDDAGRAGDFGFAKIDAGSANAPKFIVNDVPTILEKVDESVEIYQAVVNFPAKSSAVVSIYGDTYGFMHQSGNGGLGHIENEHAAWYFSGITADSPRQHDCYQKAIGRMAKISEGGCEFWTNLPAATKALVKVDATNPDGILRYYLEVVNDESVVLWETFDLFCFGGDYVSAVQGNGIGSADDKDFSTVDDGTEPASRNNSGYTKSEFDCWCWPATDDGVNAKEIYVVNRGLKDWTLVNMASLGGAVRLGNSKMAGQLTTPKLVALTGATTVNCDIDIFRFGGGVQGDIFIQVLGAGKITKADVNVNGLEVKNFDGNIQGTDIFYVDANVCPPKANNKDLDKKMTRVSLTIEGATADTQILIDGTKEATLAQARLIVDEIKVTK